MDFFLRSKTEQTDEKTSKFLFRKDPSIRLLLRCMDTRQLTITTPSFHLFTTGTAVRIRRKGDWGGKLALFQIDTGNDSVGRTEPVSDLDDIQSVHTADT